MTDYNYNWEAPEGIRKNILPIYVDKTRLAIKIGEWIITDSYMFMEDWDKLCWTILFNNNAGKGLAGPNKKRNQYYAEFLGMNPTRYAKVIKGIAYYMLMESLTDTQKGYARKLCYSKGGYNFHKLHNFAKNKEFVDDCITEGVVHCIPFATGVDPYKYMALPNVGSNTFSRNKLIASKRIRDAQRLHRTPSTILSFKGSSAFLDYGLVFIGLLKKARKLKYARAHAYHTTLVPILRKTGLFAGSQVDEYFTDPINPTEPEIQMFNLTYGVDLETDFVLEFNKALVEEKERARLRAEHKERIKAENALQKGKNRETTTVELFSY